MLQRVNERLCIRVLYAVFHFAGSSLWVPFFILVFRVHAESFAFVARLDFVFFVGRACDGMAVCQPLVFDAVFRYAVFVFDVRAQFLADSGFTANFYAAGVVIARIVVGDADFGAVVAWVAVAVFQDVFDRVRVAHGEARQRGEGDVAAAAHAPGALFFDNEGADRVAIFVDEFDAVRIDIALRVGVVFGDFDGEAFRRRATFCQNGIVFEEGFVSIRVRVGNARISGVAGISGVGIGDGGRRGSRIRAGRARIGAR